MLLVNSLLLLFFTTLQNTAATNSSSVTVLQTPSPTPATSDGMVSSSEIEISSPSTSYTEVIPSTSGVLPSSQISSPSLVLYPSTTTSTSALPSSTAPSPTPPASPSTSTSPITTASPTTPPPVTPTLSPVYENNITTYGNNTCEPYHAGGHCQNVLGRFPYVITNFSRSTQEVARTASDAIYGALIRFNASEQCFKHAIPLLCRYSFPTCDPAFVIPTYQPICRRDCEIVRDFTCKKPWEQMIRLLQLLDFGVIDQPNCEPLRNANGGDAPMCIGTVTGGDIPLPLLTGPNCYTGKGRGYNGTMNTTESGIPCQPWSSAFPHQHLLSYEDYPELEGGHNYCRNPGERGDRPWCFTTSRQTRWEYCDVPKCDNAASCESYNGSVCRTNGTIGMDFIYFNSSHSQIEYEQSMNTLVDVLREFNERCRNMMTDFVCNTNFPSCDLSSPSPRPLMPCRSFCEQVHSVCGEDIKGLKSFGALLVYDPVEIIFDCSTLPEANGGEAPECYQPITLPNTTSPSPTSPSSATSQDTLTSCYNPSDKGLSYQGTINTTTSNRVCQRWVATSPHAHPLTPLNRPYLEGHNYCRNPDGRGKRPWCYTTDPSVRWEYCNVPSCETEPTDSGTQLSNGVIYGIAGAVAFVLLLILFAVCMICSVYCYSRGVSKQKELIQIESQRYIEPVKVLGIYNKAGEIQSTNPLYVENPLKSPPPQTMEYEGMKLPEFPRDRIMYICDLGQGHFGVVVKAEAIGIKPDEEKSTVAIKVLKEGASVQVKKEFFREANLMHAFDHPNIIKLFGVCIEQEPLCMIFEFMELGDLNNLLRQNSPKAYDSSASLSRHQTGFTTQQLVDFSIDIAAGLEYLGQNHYVHRDLATRNCLVNVNMRVKISDFGLSQDIYTTDYFKLGDSELLPIRWMPPEAIVYAKFTTQSDIWSFGVVLWEIFSFGMQPYYSMTNEEVVKHVRDGSVLSCPEGCPPEIYDLMGDCWVMDPEDRPTASEIHAGLLRWNPGYSATLQAQTQVQKTSDYQNMAMVRQYAQQPSNESADACGAQYNGNIAEGSAIPMAPHSVEIEERNEALVVKPQALHLNGNGMSAGLNGDPYDHMPPLEDTM